MTPFKVGDSVLIRTVTMTQLGRIKAIGPDTILLEDCGWVAVTARFSETLKTGALDEYEKAPDGCWCLVNLHAFVDIWPWNHPLPKTSK